MDGHGILDFTNDLPSRHEPSTTPSMTVRLNGPRLPRNADSRRPSYASRRGADLEIDTGRDDLLSPASTLQGSNVTFYFAGADSDSDESGSATPTASTPLLISGKGKSKGGNRSKFPSYDSTPSSSAASEAGIACTRTPTPLPMKQIYVLLFAQLAEPVVATVILPFINQLISELGVTGGDDKKIGYYAGIVESMFFFCEFCCILHWGRLSDRIGRKPVLIFGLTGLTLSVALFGMSTTYATVVMSRALAGVLSGNVGVFKSMMGEITDETNIAEGFALMPVVWSAGSTLGPILGGFLSHPESKWPTSFNDEFWSTYPYALPCFAAALVCIVAASVVAFFLEESLPSLKKKNRLEQKEYSCINDSLDDLLDTPRPPISHRRSISEETLVDIPPPPPALRDILTPSVIIAVSNYCSLSLLDIAYVALIPLFYATPIEHGGLGLTPSQIGSCLAVLGIVNGIIQCMFAAKVQRRVGLKFMFLFGVSCYFVIFAIFPAMNVLARKTGELSWPIYCLMLTQLMLTICVNASFGCSFIFVNSAAERSSLGATNGIAQTSVSLIRTFGPTAATCLFALSVERNLAGGKLVYWILMALTGGAVYNGTRLPSKIF